MNILNAYSIFYQSVQCICCIFGLFFYWQIFLFIDHLPVVNSKQRYLKYYFNYHRLIKGNHFCFLAPQWAPSPAPDRVLPEPPTSSADLIYF